MVISSDGSRDDTVISTLESVDSSIRTMIESSLEMLVPVEPQPFRPDKNYGDYRYNSFAHADLCRMKMLGLSDASAAAAVGISHTRLTTWLRNRPKLAVDMKRAAQLANAQMAMLLRRMALGHGQVAFNAIKLFLTTHSPEFQERTTIEVSAVDSAAVLDQIKSGMYGISSDPSPLPALPVASDDSHPDDDLFSDDSASSLPFDSSSDILAGPCDFDL